MFSRQIYFRNKVIDGYCQGETLLVMPMLGYSHIKLHTICVLYSGVRETHKLPKVYMRIWDNNNKNTTMRVIVSRLETLTTGRACKTSD